MYSVNSPHGPSVSSYITFSSKRDALECIKAIDGFWLEHRPLRYEDCSMEDFLLILL